MTSILPVPRLDHLVLTVEDVGATLSFYQKVLGMEPVTFGDGRQALSFGNQKINLHPAGGKIDPTASRPAPGSADLCFLVDLPTEALQIHLDSLGIVPVLGPVRRTGATGPLVSVYVRDPDGNLVEIARQETSGTSGTETPILFESDRLLFRNFHLSDKDAVHGYASDPSVTRMTYWGPYTPSETESFLRRAIRGVSETPRSFYDLAIVAKERGPLSPPVGGCKLHVTDRQNREAEIGYYLEQKSWNRGFASETARALLSFGFSRLGLHRMVALCFVENRGSAHVLEKIGMTREGTYRKHRRKEGRWVDSFLYSILDSEWKSLPENGNRNGTGGACP